MDIRSVINCIKIRAILIINSIHKFNDLDVLQRDATLVQFCQIKNRQPCSLGPIHFSL
jgi:hypothetical protein